MDTFSVTAPKKKMQSNEISEEDYNSIYNPSHVVLIRVPPPLPPPPPIIPPPPPVESASGFQRFTPSLHFSSFPITSIPHEDPDEYQGVRKPCLFHHILDSDLKWLQLWKLQTLPLANRFHPLLFRFLSATDKLPLQCTCKFFQFIRTGLTRPHLEKRLSYLPKDLNLPWYERRETNWLAKSFDQYTKENLQTPRYAPYYPTLFLAKTEEPIRSFYLGYYKIIDRSPKKTFPFCIYSLARLPIYIISTILAGFLGLMGCARLGMTSKRMNKLLPYPFIVFRPFSRLFRNPRYSPSFQDDLKSYLRILAIILHRETRIGFPTKIRGVASNFQEEVSTVFLTKDLLNAVEYNTWPIENEAKVAENGILASGRFGGSDIGLEYALSEQVISPEQIIAVQADGKSRFTTFKTRAKELQYGCIDDAKGDKTKLEFISALMKSFRPWCEYLRVCSTKKRAWYKETRLSNDQYSQLMARFRVIFSSSSGGPGSEKKTRVIDALPRSWTPRPIGLNAIKWTREENSHIYFIDSTTSICLNTQKNAWHLTEGEHTDVDVLATLLTFPATKEIANIPHDRVKKVAIYVRHINESLTQLKRKSANRKPVVSKKKRQKK